tara:strand:+ start:2216 stop:2413 length:198 start_codon:yes stop_codon:yes gene_type:complete
MDPIEQARLQAEVTYTGFIKFLKWISLIAIILVLVMGFNNFLDDPSASQSDPSWKSEYKSNMGMK